MAKNVMLFGAGASVQAGAPVMSNFLDVARELVFEHQDQKTATSFNNVFGAISRLQAVHSKAEFDIKNLESIFTAFELAKTVRKFPGTEPAEIDGLIEDLKRVIIATLESTMKFEREDLELRAPGPYREFLKKLLHGPNPTSLALLTFNYDMVLDAALNDIAVDADYAVGVGKNFQRSIPLLKLHGSLNWASTARGKIYPFFLPSYFQTFRKDVGGQGTSGLWPFPIGKRIGSIVSTESISEAINEVPVIVPPSWNKADSHRSISSVWERAAKELGEADSIFIIGYSLPQTDTFFRQLYALGSAGPVLLKRFWVYDIDKSREEVFKGMLGPGARERFRFHQMDAFSALRDIAQQLGKNPL